ncbi:MAG: FAD-dependent monooxygenase, partial [Paracoccaceae bacterium]|nr:FAD-dependent monooxygenase [Paracoccaceae bacterium]
MGSGDALQTDVLIVGAGPTGLLLANLLGTMGVAATLIEKHQTTVQDPRAVSIDDESIRALQAAGLADDVARIIVQGYGSIYRGPSGRPFASVIPTTKDYGFYKRNAFEQPVFEGVLREALRRHPSLTVWFQTELVDFEQTNQTVQASVTCGDG